MTARCGGGQPLFNIGDLLFLFILKMASAQSVERRRKRQMAVAIREAEIIDAVNREAMELSDGSRSWSTEVELHQSVQAIISPIGSNPSEHKNDFLNRNSSESKIYSLINRLSSSSSDDNESSLFDFETNDSVEKNLRQHLASWVVKSNVQQKKSIPYCKFWLLILLT